MTKALPAFLVLLCALTIVSCYKRSILLFPDSYWTASNYSSIVNELQTKLQNIPTVILVSDIIATSVSQFDAAVSFYRNELINSYEPFNFTAGDKLYVASHGFSTSGRSHQRWAKGVGRTKCSGSIFLAQIPEDPLRLFFTHNVTFVSGSWVLDPSVVDYCERFQTDVLDNTRTGEGFNTPWSRTKAMQLIEGTTFSDFANPNFKKPDDLIPSVNPNSRQDKIAIRVANWIKCMEGDASSCTSVTSIISYSSECANAFSLARQWDEDNLCKQFWIDTMNLTPSFEAIPRIFSNIKCGRNFQCVFDSYPTISITLDTVLNVSLVDSSVSGQGVTDDFRYIESLRFCKSRVREYFWDYAFSRANFQRLNNSISNVFGIEKDPSVTQETIFNQSLTIAMMPTAEGDSPGERFSRVGMTVNVLPTRTVTGGPDQVYSFTSVLSKVGYRNFTLQPQQSKGTYNLITGPCPNVICNLRTLGAQYTKFAETRELLRFIWATSFIQ